MRKTAKVKAKMKKDWKVLIVEVQKALIFIEALWIFLTDSLLLYTIVKAKTNT